MRCSRLELVDWRRRIQQLYAEVRATYSDDPRVAHRRWREGRDELFANHPCSPLPEGIRASFTGLDVAPYDPEFAFAAAVERDGSPAPLEVTASSGHAMGYERLGVVDLPVGRLEMLWLEGYAGGIFLPFTDATSGRTTYAGGRYLLDTPKAADLGSAADGRLVLDLNFAYHPSCHYDPVWTCPLAPAANRLSVPIDAGELAFRP